MVSVIVASVSADRGQSSSWLRALARGLFFLNLVLGASDGQARSGVDHGSAFAVVASSDAWRAVLFYSPRFLRAESSIVDADAFFLAPDGRHDSAAELRATLAAFRKEESQPTANELTRCRFPARYHFLQRSFTDLQHDAATCPWVHEYLEAVRPSKVSLVFSSFYMNNPASMMGHTFLRYHRAGQPGQIQSPFLDYVVNFAATPTTDNQLLYAFSGISGLFPGTFSLSPYYLKIGEYVSFESRDLWEYPLALSEAEVYLMLLSTLEVGQHRINYFYVDENCSYLMLFFLDVARPELRLRYLFHSIVTPSDTMSVVYGTGITNGIRYVPSQRQRFRTVYDELSEPQRSVLHGLVDDAPADSMLDLDARLAPLPIEQRTAVIDSMIEYIGYVEKLVGERHPEMYAKIYPRLLVLRAKAPAAALTSPRIPVDLAPHLTHLSKRFSLGAMRQKSPGAAATDLMTLGLRPSFHDALTPSGGFPRGLGIELGTTIFSIDAAARRARLEHFRLVEINSIQPLAFDNRVPSWKLALGYGREPVEMPTGGALGGVYLLKGGIGPTLGLWSDELLASLLILPELTATPAFRSGIRAGIFAGPELLAYGGRHVSLAVYAHWGAFADARPKVPRRYGMNFKLSLWDVCEVELRHQLLQDVRESNVTLHYFF